MDYIEPDLSEMEPLIESSSLSFTSFTYLSLSLIVGYEFCFLMSMGLTLIWRFERRSTCLCTLGMASMNDAQLSESLSFVPRPLLPAFVYSPVNILLILPCTSLVWIYFSIMNWSELGSLNPVVDDWFFIMTGSWLINDSSEEMIDSTSWSSWLSLSDFSSIFIALTLGMGYVGRSMPLMPLLSGRWLLELDTISLMKLKSKGCWSLGCDYLV